ncbi:response regulator transcription factor [Schinkia azotoformans]|uniref:response regulator transcription factor n=1 Tax=Schinkia azotoformans TaxID=1454 RepID=UPI002DB89CFB|nr:response regulator transcription factor [Schinkia azotoformans]MEC1717909.1 response regulator transcription factor [Schinkia azotoformans]MEC1741058.1 response regulator transcription factor [Schinkia azotoformans]MEC1744203.1 response regulator transcription factor [Schinkia azotoformans]MEC1756639.1 response regulator transcription factor [Schinkia azotoformans]MEC1768069.1 response regulator transcription factor [Schinkia azotoformans]
MFNVFIVEDEQTIVDVLHAYFEKEGWSVNSATNGSDGLHLIKILNPDFIILDLMLPDISGEEICREIRKESNVPIIMLTAKTAEEDRIQGIEMGADDYILKPFSPRELIVRMKAILRRIDRFDNSSELTFNNRDLIIKEKENEIIVNGKYIELTQLEFKLLTEMAKSPGIVFSRSNLLKLIQSDGFYEGYERSIDVHIKNIRKKMEVNTKQPQYIQTVFGVGYRFGGKPDAALVTF